MTLWTWQASTSPDVAAYVLAAALRWVDLSAPPDEWGTFPMQQSLTFTDRVTVDAATLSADDGLPDPPLGSAWLLTVDAVDGAGNRSSGE